MHADQRSRVHRACDNSFALFLSEKNANQEEPQQENTVSPDREKVDRKKEAYSVNKGERFANYTLYSASFPKCKKEIISDNFFVPTNHLKLKSVKKLFTRIRRK